MQDEFQWNEIKVVAVKVFCSFIFPSLLRSSIRSFIGFLSVELDKNKIEVDCDEWINI